MRGGQAGRHDNLGEFSLSAVEIESTPEKS